MMQAIVQDSYGTPCDVLRLRAVEQPTIRDDEVLVRVQATSVHPDVWHVVTGRPYVLRILGAGLRRPKIRIPGTDLAGQVEAVGRQVERFKPGDEVFGESHAGTQWQNGGAFAQYAAVPAASLALKPDNVSFAQAAAVPTSGIIAMIGLHDGELARPGRRVLINGAGGNVGTLLVQLAKFFGAHVTGVDRRSKFEMLRSLGADELIDYTQRDITRGDACYDLIIDVASTLSVAAGKRALNPAGQIVHIGNGHFGAVGGPVLGSLPGSFGLALRSFCDPRLAKPYTAFQSRRHYMQMLAGLLASAQLTPVIDRTYSLRAVVDAIAYLVSGEAAGKIIIAPWKNLEETFE